MRVEFRQGVPHECVEWLWRNIGSGNVSRIHSIPYRTPNENDAWFYERIAKPISPNAFSDDPFECVPTITVKDEKLAMLFILRWE